MTIEEKVFARKHFLPEKMPRCGFVRTEGGWKYEADLMNGDFTARIFVSDGGTAKGKLIDNMNGEEFAALNVEGFQGAYIGAVRTAYENLLNAVCAGCSEEVLFTGAQANRIAARIKERFGVVPDFPFDEDPHLRSGVFRHTDTAKWFALMMNVRRAAFEKNRDERRADVINLKASPETIASAGQRPGVYPAYHMNKNYWITVSLDDLLPDSEVMALIDESFRLTERKPPHKAKK